MSIAILFKVAGVGLITAVVVQMLKQSGRDELATVAGIVGLIIGTGLMLSMVSSLLETMQQLFSLYG